MRAEPPTVRIIGVTGGVGDLAATYDAVRALADGYDAAAHRMRDWAGLGARTMADADLVESAPLSPLTFAEAEASVLAATAGPDGILVESAGWEVDAVLVRCTVASLEETDRLVHDAVEALDNAVGRTLGLGLGLAAPLLVPAVIATDQVLPPGARRALAEEAGPELEDWVVDHPGVVQHLVDGGGGLLEGLWDGLAPLAPGGPLGLSLLTPDTESGAGLLAMLYGDDGTAEVTPRPDLAVPSHGTQPDSLAGLVGHLQQVAALSHGSDSPANGTIEVQTLDPGTDHVRHVVYLPGTDDLTTLPWTQDDDVRDMGTNLLLVAGRDNAYQQGILEAMTRSGIGPDEPVLLVGHSQGGMEAAAILSQGSDFEVTDVVTAGSPTAQVDGFPAGSHVLSLEHRGDVVPLLDGEDNPDSVEQVTVTFDDGGAGIEDHHGYAHYVAGAAAADASTDPSVTEQLASLRGHGFLASPEGPEPAVSSRVFQIVRWP